ncbi:outer membrane protein [Rhodovulum sp. PH10]|uniref:outer membrane protein n=1 Tax=Rhodovulum sp. PH10 TaxID=1187851 RepID=UPI00027C2D90|nr:outer membrane beta-barrel protein [Rhodovulum sp. PH10]EJW11518.1 outer membrane protein [Rhodovulum sp. PH10]
MKKFLLATVATVAMAGMASAADLPARMPVKAPPVVAPVFSWTGCYIGGYVGGAWAEDATASDEYLSGVTVPLYNYGYSPDSSFIGGGTLGCNWQPVGSPFVLGIEGEVGYISLEGSALDPFDPTVTSSTKIGDWYGMITGRLGYSWDRMMIYVKGGAAFVDVENTLTDTFFGFSSSTSDTITTWTVGGGVEWALDPNWSIKAEYMYIALDETQTQGAFVTGVGTVVNDIQIDGIHTAKVGLNYRFGSAPPLLARY